MASYATEVKVESLMAQFIIDETTSPSSTELTTIIEDVEGEIDTALRTQGVSTPVATPTYLLDWLEGLASTGAAARALKSMFPDAGGPGQVAASEFYQRIYERGLAGIRDGTMIPPEAVSSGSSVSPSTYFTRNPDEEEALGSIAEPFFTRSKTF